MTQNTSQDVEKKIVLGFSTENRISILQMVTNLASQESDRFWTRFSMLLYANTGILAIFQFTSPQDTTRIVVAFFGLLLSFMWLIWNRQSSFYNMVWLKDHEAILSHDKELAALITGIASKRITPPFSGVFTEKYKIWNLPVYVFVLLWLVLLIEITSKFRLQYIGD